MDLEHNVAYQTIVARTTPLFKTADGRPIVGGRPMNKPPLIDQVTLGKYGPQVQAEYKARWQRYHDAEAQTDKALQQAIDGQRRDIGLDVSSQRTAATAERETAAANARTQAQINAAALLEQNREKSASQLQVDKAALDEHNARYADTIKRAEPRSDKDLAEMNADVGGSSYVPLARAMIPEAAARTDLKDDNAQAMLSSAGYDPGMQRTIGQAFQSALKLSSLSSRDEVAAGIGQLATGRGGEKNSNQYDKRTDTYHITVALDGGGVANITLPATTAIAISQMGQKFAMSRPGVEQAIRMGKPVEERPSGARGAAPAIPTMQDWQTQATPSQQTQQPPF